MQKLVLLFLIFFIHNIQSQTVYYEMYTYGHNSYYQLGDGTTTQRTSPIRVDDKEDYSFISVGTFNVFAIKTDGTLWAWGRNQYGEIGDGTTVSVQVPTQIGTDNDWAKVSNGYAHTLAIKTDGTLWGWGWNGNGQLGNGTTGTSLVPIQIGSDTDWESVSAGFRHSIGTKTDGTLWAWGQNTNGQVGDGTTTQRTSPVQIGSDTDWSFVETGSSHNVALKTNGTIWGWGENDSYKLGSGTITPVTAPTQIGSDSDWSKIRTFKFHSMGIKTDGTLWGWGRNSFDQIDGTDISTTIEVPTQIGVETWNDVDVGENHTIAIKSDGTLWGWGWNTTGAVGKGNTSSNSIQNQIGSDTDWYQVHSGEWFSTALKIAPTYTLSGNITDAGTGISDISVSNGIETVTTNSSGEYNFSNMPASTFTITPSNNSYEFDPESIEVVISSNTTGIDFTATRLSDEPNGGDGNGDGTPDYLQNSVVTLKDISDNYYVTISCQDGYSLNETGTYQSSDSEFFYPMGMFQFKINASSATVKLYFHDISSLGNYIYRKVYSGSIYRDFENVTYSLETIGANTVLVATITLVDGGLGDFDGEVNGVIYDPGGPALPITANIPFWDWWWLILIIPSLIFVSYKYR